MRNYLNLNTLCLHRFNRLYQGCEHQLNPEAEPSLSSFPSVVCTRPFLYSLAQTTSISYLTSYVVQGLKTLKNKNSTLRLCCYRDVCWLTSHLNRPPAYPAGFACFEMPSAEPGTSCKGKNSKPYLHPGFLLFKSNLQYICLSYRECLWNTKQVPPSLCKDWTALKRFQSTPALTAVTTDLQ